MHIEKDHAEILLLAVSLAQIARSEIERLDQERPNDPASIAKNLRQREILEILAQGFEQISKSMAAIALAPEEPVLLGKARRVVSAVGDQLNSWWKRHGEETVDWGIKIPVFGAGVALLKWAGADMAIATSALAVIVGGSDVVKTLANKLWSKRRVGKAKRAHRFLISAF